MSYAYFDIQPSPDNYGIPSIPVLVWIQNHMNSMNSLIYVHSMILSAVLVWLKKGEPNASFQENGNRPSMTFMSLCLKIRPWFEWYCMHFNIWSALVASIWVQIHRRHHFNRCKEVKYWIALFEWIYIKPYIHKWFPPLNSFHSKNSVC